MKALPILFTVTAILGGVWAAYPTAIGYFKGDMPAPVFSALSEALDSAPAPESKTVFSKGQIVTVDVPTVGHTASGTISLEPGTNLQVASADADSITVNLGGQPVVVYTSVPVQVTDPAANAVAQWGMLTAPGTSTPGWFGRQNTASSMSQPYASASIVSPERGYRNSGYLNGGGYYSGGVYRNYSTYGSGTQVVTTRLTIRQRPRSTAGVAQFRSSGGTVISSQTARMSQPVSGRRLRASNTAEVCR